MHDDIPASDLEILSPNSRRKLIEIISNREGVEAAALAQANKHNANMGYKQDCERELRRQMEYAGIAGMEDQIARAKAKHDEAIKALAISFELMEAASAKVSQWDIVSGLTRWLSEQNYEAQRNKISFRERRYRGKLIAATPIATVKALRLDLKAIDIDYQRVVAAPATSAEIVAVVANQLEEFTSAVGPTISRTNRNDPLGLASGSAVYGGSYGPLAAGTAGSPNAGVAMLVWLLQDAIAARLPALIGPDTPGALTYEEREEVIAKLAVKRLDLERQEEAAILAAEAEGTFIPRRPDADPRAVLEIEEA